MSSPVGSNQLRVKTALVQNYRYFGQHAFTSRVRKELNVLQKNTHPHPRNLVLLQAEFFDPPIFVCDSRCRLSKTDCGRR